MILDEKKENLKSDWHRDDILAAIKKRGTSLTRISIESGLASTTLGNALYRHWPKGDRLIAQALGLFPEEIWPSRYGNQCNNEVKGDTEGL